MKVIGAGTTKGTPFAIWLVSSFAGGAAMCVGLMKNNVLGLKRLRYAPGNDAEKVAGGVP